MFKKYFVLTTVFLMLSITVFAGGKKVNFSGEWVLDYEKIKFPL